MILVNKYGLIFRRETVAVGEQGETEAMLRHLAENHEVAYFGQWKGDHIPGIRVYEPHIEGLDHMSTADAQRKCFDQDMKMLPEIECVVQSCGYAPTTSMIDNQTGSSVQGCAIRSCGPILNIINQTGVPRYLVNSDPRTYPRDAEITDLPRTRPAALLDQWNIETNLGIRGTKYKRRSVYAAIETWPEFPESCFNIRQGSIVIAHCHVRDGMRRGETLEDAWDEILRGTDAQVFGKGWNLTGLPRIHGDRGWAEVSPAVALAHLAGACSGPIVAHTPRFATLKMKTYASQGCVPLLWSVGPHAYDPTHRYVPRGSWLRFHDEDELMEKTSELERRPELRKELVEMVQDMTKPDWAVLDSLIENGESFVDYGGYL